MWNGALFWVQVDSATGSATTARRLASLATAASHFLVSTLV